MPDPARRTSAFEEADPASVATPRPAYDPDNAFLPILSGEAPAHKVLETEHSVGFLDAFPVRPPPPATCPRGRSVRVAWVQYAPGHCLLPQGVHVAQLREHLPHFAMEEPPNRRESRVGDGQPIFPR